MQGELVWGTPDQDGQYKKTANNAKLHKHFPDFQFTHFDKAIEESCRWFVDNFNTVRK